MFALSATCVAIALADKAGTLRLEARVNQRLVAMGLDGAHVAICDDRGIIEVADDMPAAERRVADLRARAA